MIDFNSANPNRASFQRSRWLARTGFVIGLALLGLSYQRMLHGSSHILDRDDRQCTTLAETSPEVAPANSVRVNAVVARSQSSGFRTKSIQDIRVGDRVLAHNPQVADQERNVPDPCPATWRHLKLQVEQNGIRFDIELLRPVEWLRNYKAAVGRTIRLVMPEMGLDGDATVLAIAPCPRIKSGEGRVVTGTFANRTCGNLLDLHVEGLDKPIGCTEAHPFWSEDRHSFVFAGRLRSGEQMLMRSGHIRSLLSVEKRRTTEVVYNLEVDVEHAFYVSSLGLLVHNDSPVIPPPTETGPPRIYREGGSNTGNLTPRPQDEGTLSGRDSLSNPYPLPPEQNGRPNFRPGEPYIEIDPDKLPPGSVIRDNTPPGHVGIKNVPPDVVKGAITGKGKLPKDFPNWW
jgi:hypothetical protein